MNSHCSETEIQQYALDKSGCTKMLVQHIESCNLCMTEIRNYQMIFSEIKQSSIPVFDFDLAGQVIAQLPKPKTGLTPDRFIAGFLIIFICCCVGLPVFLFGQYILNMFSGIPSFFIYATTISAACILIFKILVMYKKYHRQMQVLNFN